MSAEELMHEAFSYLNAFKRARALEQVERQKGNNDKAAMHKLSQYESFDKLELSMRALQKNIRGQEADTDH